MSQATLQPDESEQIIKSATLADSEQMADLLAELFSQEADFMPNREKQLAGIRMILERPESGNILVLRNGARIVGMVTLIYVISTAEGGRVAWLEDFIIRAECRGRGLGAKLLAGALAFAKTQGITRVTLLTDGENLRAQEFYSRHGFSRSAMIPMRCYLA